MNENYVVTGELVYANDGWIRTPTTENQARWIKWVQRCGKVPGVDSATFEYENALTTAKISWNPLSFSIPNLVAELPPKMKSTLVGSFSAMITLCKNVEFWLFRFG